MAGVDPAMEGTPLTTRSKPGGMFHRANAQSHLDAAALLEMHHQVLDRLTGLHKLAHALDQLVVVEQRRVLYSGLVKLDANGIWSENFPSGARAIFVVNFVGNQTITLHASPQGSGAPGAGPGVHQVLAGMAAGFNNKTTDWTIYGQAGQLLDVQVFSVPITPSAATV